jgi:isochorismate synthase
LLPVLLDPQFVTHALDSLDIRPYRDSHVALTVRCQMVSFEKLMCTDLLGHRFFWDPRGVEFDMGPSFVGAGVTSMEFDGGGSSRFQRVPERTAAIFRGLVEFRDEHCESAPSPVFVGGAAFAGGQRRETPWSWFSDELFVLPRWRVALGDGCAYATWTLKTEELGDRNKLLVELATATDVLTRSPTLKITLPRMQSEQAMSRESWTDLVNNALKSIRSGAFRKLVPVRRTVLTLTQPIDPPTVLSRASAKYRECTRFWIEREDHSFVGASPERLIRVKERDIETDALAGSLPRAPADDLDALIAELRAHKKNKREHREVVDALKAVLLPLTDELTVSDVPLVRSLANLVHLWTPITATLKQKIHPLQLVALLHPTPAIAGTPKEQAVRWLLANEPVGRGWFSGPVGWFDARGHGAFVVALRSMVLCENRAWLYAGAGVVEGSDPDAEYEETAAKLNAMRTALGFS